jgi:hypothetical protein
MRQSNMHRKQLEFCGNSIANKPTGNFGLNNYPNPFYQTTTIEYRLHKNGKAKTNCLRSFGKKIASLIDETQTGR